MSFFSHFHAPGSSDVLRLLDELNQYSPSSFLSTTSSSPNGGNRGAFSPNFDVHETESAFILEGELPGLGDKSEVSIEFTDNNTLLLRGRIEKSIHKASPSHESNTTDGNAITTTPTKENKVATRTDKSVVNPTGNLRYWISERSVGEFQRSFSFPGAVNIDEVKASLENGILKVVVPKKELVKGRKIEIC